MKTATKAKIAFVAGLSALEILIGGIFPSLGAKSGEHKKFTYEANKKPAVVEKARSGLGGLVNGIFSPESALADQLTPELIKAEADKYFQKNDYNNAVIKYNEAISRGLTSKEDRYMSELNLGFSLAELGKFDQSLPHYKKAVELGAPFKENTYNSKKGFEDDYNKAMDYYKSGNYIDAIDLFEEIRSEDSLNITLLNNLGWAYKENGNIDKAEGVFKETIKINPLDVVAYTSLGFLLNEKGNCSESDHYFNVALIIEPNMDPKYKQEILGIINQ